MKRKDFFKRLGLGAAALIVAPKVIAEALEEVKKPLPSAKVAAPWDVKRSPKGEWHEDARVHNYVSSWVNSVNGTTIRVKAPKDHPLRLYDTVMVNSNIYMVSDVSIGYYSFINKESGSIIELVPYSSDTPAMKVNDYAYIVLMGNS